MKVHGDRKRQGMRPVPVILSEQEIDYLVARHYQLTRADDRSIGRAVWSNRENTKRADATQHLAPGVWSGFSVADATSEGVMTADPQSCYVVGPHRRPDFFTQSKRSPLTAQYVRHLSC
jgi:hypothetical protein